MADTLSTTCAAFSLLFASATLARAQSSLEWLGIHDGPASQEDNGARCAVDASGNVYVCGTSFNAVPPTQPTSDIETVKYSATGVELWSRRFDNFGKNEVAGDIAVDAAGDVYVTGVSSGSTNSQLALLKYQPDGTLVWSRTLVGTASTGGTRIAFDAASNALVLGTFNDSFTHSDVFVASYSPLGQLLWSTHVDGGSNVYDIGRALAVTPSGDIYVAGAMTPSLGATDFGLVKLSSSGTLQWTRLIDGGSGDWDNAIVIAVSGNDRIAIAGQSGTAVGGDVGVIEFDAAGNASPIRRYDGPLHGGDYGYGAAIDAGGVLWVLGGSYGIGTATDFVVLRYDAAGQLLTTTRYDGPAHNHDQPYDLVLGTAGGAIVCGHSRGPSPLLTDSDVVLVQYDADGNQILASTFSTPGIFQDLAYDVDLAPNGRLAVAGKTSGASGGYDYLTLQFDASEMPQGYCTAKINSLGCTPLIDFTGLSSAGAASGFVVRASNVRNRQNGMLLCGVSGAAALPFQGGTLCVNGPLRRAPPANSHGAPAPVNDCSGVYTLDVNAFASGALGGAPLPALLVPGTQVHCQWRGRDPGFAAPNNTEMSSGVSYRVLP